MTLIYTFGNPQQAAIAKGMLESNGIGCVLMQSPLSAIYPTPDGDNFGGVKLYAEDDKAPEAVRLLREHGDLEGV